MVSGSFILSQIIFLPCYIITKNLKQCRSPLNVTKKDQMLKDVPGFPQTGVSPLWRTAPGNGGECLSLFAVGKTEKKKKLQ